MGLAMSREDFVRIVLVGKDEGDSAKYIVVRYTNPY
jgi:hypothetical protein